jgi:ParB family chromosome partitioning protein
MSNEILGKGLKSLIPEDFSQDNLGREAVSWVDSSKILISDHQPRKTVNDKTINELSDSILEHGVLQPLVVSKRDDGNYQLIVGQRRLLASRKAGLKDIPVIIKDVDVKDEMEIALIENIQREDLNSIEEAEGYNALINKFNIDIKDVAKKVGKGESTIVNSLRLLTLDPKVKEALRQGKISAGHARALITLSKEDQLKKMEEIIASGLSVREVEANLKSINKPKNIKIEKDIYIESLEKDLRGVLGTKVFVQPKGKGGKIVINYYSKEELDNISDLIRSIEDIKEV